MKPLPKKFQFKCDEHSLEQCKKLGIELDDWDRTNMKYSSENYFLIKESGIDYNYKPYNQDLYPIISLADYIEEPNPEYIYSDIDKQSERESDLIVELTGKYVACMATDLNVHSFELDSPLVKKAIDLAEETVKQLKERGYIK
jgi:hypothetical protein